jgi:hypothetical protein
MGIVWLCFAAQHKNLVVDFAVTSARTICGEYCPIVVMMTIGPVRIDSGCIPHIPRKWAPGAAQPP